MLVKVRCGYTLKVEGDVYIENTILDISDALYKDKQHILEALVPRSDAEKAFYEKKVKELAEGKKVIATTKISVQVRGGYSYVDPMSKKLYPSGSKIEIPEKDYFERHWLFEPVEPVKEEEKSEEKIIDGQEVGMIVLGSAVPKEEKIEEEKSEEEKDMQEKVNEEREKEEEELEGKVDDKIMTTSTNRAILRRPSRVPKTKKKDKKD